MTEGSAGLGVAVDGRDLPDDRLGKPAVALDG